MRKFFTKKSSGFTLVETLVALSIFTVSILGLMSVLASGISNTTYAKQKITASYLVQEGIEYIRNMRDKEVLFGGSFNSFKTALSSCRNENNACSFNPVFPHTVGLCSDCKLYLTNGSYTSTGTNYSGFTRRIWRELVGSGQDEVKIFSRVEWTQGSGTPNITFSENLKNWTE
jgi:prepilin-type N-terminal cleavage/methylation domain-containing protein